MSHRHTSPLCLDSPGTVTGLVVSVVLSRPSARRSSGRSAAISRLRREGTDPALRGLRAHQDATQPAGALR